MNNVEKGRTGQAGGGAAWYITQMSRSLRFILSVAGAVTIMAAIMSGAPRQRMSSVPVYRYQVVRSYPHDRQAFTQGLAYLNDVLYEGTGLNGQSSIRKVRLESGEVLQQRKLEQHYFGEGIAVWGKTLIQLTWQSEIGFVYDLASFDPVKTFGYAGEGWGLTHDGTRLIMSDGSPALRFLDPVSFKETARLTVKEGSAPVDDLNELEWVKGEIFANVWQSQRIARINPKTGQVTGWIDLSGLLSPREAAGTDVMNGIAYDAKGDRLFVTGKLWPRIFEIRIVPSAQGPRLGSDLDFRSDE
jgi:glutaminyl-peptide cyclotransferase